jgi:glycosyltransferase involved in cell wall biosynthesis
MLTPAALPQFGRPIVWTLHDMWPFTGGCHYDNECGRYSQSCGRCPVLGSERERDLSRLVWNRKRRAWSELEIRVIAPSRWLADCARRSSLFGRYRIEVVPNGLDLEVFRPIDRKSARELIGLPPDGRIILFGAHAATTDVRKGFSHLQEASFRLADLGEPSAYRLVLLGATHSPLPLGLESHGLGILQDDVALALAYSAADVFVAPSLQDNLPNTVMEALACGTPCVAFDIGGMPDLIEHEHNGYLARPFDASDLANGIAWTLSDADRWQRLSLRAREKCEQEFEFTKVAARHVALYRDILGGDLAPAR